MSIDASLWQPSAKIRNLRLRAEVLKQVRDFFAECNVLEVQTPVLGRAGSTDAYLSSMQSRCSGGGLSEPLDLYLQTSPEFHMKRLLAAGSGAIWQLATSFRNGEVSERHNPEFAMLEWYQPGYDLNDLMAEVQALISEVLEVDRFSCQSYRSLFRQHLEVDPFTSELSQLQRLSHDKTGITAEELDRDACCDLLMSSCIEPLLGRDEITFVIDYPASQAALAKVKTDDEGDQVAARFECYYRGIELANGYHELTDAAEQAQRFAEDNRQRKVLGLPEVTVDQYLVAALDSGIPECAGVALGFDRLLMLKAGADRLSDVISFSIDRA
ncbi:elongation factor P--(R)-beta-lysine ligase [Oceanospirillum linum]|uniref:Elongation factor P lysine(34) lysyltransferase n=1 Tax=Oceanospirillum linum TaxID=966 RepID=A0A1T1H9E0_OCELI|nr:elongation factor P--(R)-beta-lysine ligase [Oceanospirillum linum]OOV86386.1 elongation factor P lysine(34) lysyltransferase [Oceanospirillum linum]SEG31844.1 lysyl-tRNA synthetase, class 2 [Oleiphilus messinensis]SMP28487.1 lysyl-tRNA synthetase, class 2 [Oceanospirillum linum]